MIKTTLEIKRDTQALRNKCGLLLDTLTVADKVYLSNFLHGTLFQFGHTEDSFVRITPVINSKDIKGVIKLFDVQFAGHGATVTRDSLINHMINGEIKINE